jgi:hypothetical protein
VLLAEDLLVLLVGRSATIVARFGGTQAALASALLMELAVADRLGIDRDGTGRLHIFVDDLTPLGDPLVDAALAEVATVDGETTYEVVRALVPGLYVHVLDRLVARGVLARRALGGWRLVHSSRRDFLRAWLGDVLDGQVEPDWNSGALISLLDMLSAVKLIRTGSAAAERASVLAHGGWPAGEVTQAIATDCLDIVATWTSIGNGLSTWSP